MKTNNEEEKWRHARQKQKNGGRAARRKEKEKGRNDGKAENKTDANIITEVVVKMCERGRGLDGQHV